MYCNNKNIVIVYLSKRDTLECPLFLSSSGLLLLYGSLTSRRGCWIVSERIAKAAAEGTHLQSQVRPVGRRHFGTRLQRGKSFAASLFLYAVLQYAGTQYTLYHATGIDMPINILNYIPLAANTPAGYTFTPVQQLFTPALPG